MNQKKYIKEIKKSILIEFNIRNRFKGILINIMIVVSSFFEIAIAWIMQLAINAITDKKLNGEFFFAIILAAVVLLIMALLSYIKERLKNSYGKKFAVFLKNKMFSNMIEKNIVEFENNNTGEYHSIFQTDIMKLMINYLYGKWTIVEFISLCFIGIVSMLVMSLKLSLIVLCLQTIPMILTLILGNKLAKCEKLSSKERGNFGSAVQDYLKGFRLIKMFSAENYFMKKFMNVNDKSEVAEMNTKNTAVIIEVVNSISNYIIIIGLFLFGGLETIKGNMKIGTVIACFELLGTISTPLSGISMQINLVRSTDAIFERIYDLFFKDDKKEISKNIIKINKIDDIEFSGVSFSYDNEVNVLENINIKFEKGKKYAIVGNSGSGKSTILKLLLGYYENFTGEILYNNYKQEQIGIEQINKYISVVQQDVFVFNDTLEANISMDTENKTVGIGDAIQKSGFSEFVKKNGLKFLCEEDGKNLSGGEKQRLSIARAILRNSGVILFDEATASLDNLTTLKIEDTINSLNSTCIVITHKLDLDVLRRYDQIVVLSKGKIVETGTVDEVMDLKNEFYNLYTTSV